ncbi:ABC transporter permease [Dissulfurirhabdus thermomarina]|uniref:Transport permease protein n=1 Tax=Dissulfurirhabdus thermomarina TaxID=1765737 RepID=A0A6N9TPU0_DISTH|nr:ABC transporter permease [Dissulfurirhabdus thermomarina]NDY43291.1 ABC transporter permease [Dissulfurirhabdus thermomarina]NMX24178.1 ABC transporter permease [Dissulfurirhabdus thermomarina]
MSHRFLKVWARNARVWRKHVRASLIGNLGQPFLFLVAMGYGLGRDIPEIQGLTYLQFIAPGLVASAVMYSAAFEATYGSYTRLSTQRTFEAILMTPVTVEELALGEIAWGATKGLLSGAIMLAALPLFGVWPSAWTAALLPVLFVEGVFFAALGLIMTALAANYEFFNYFTSLLITPLFLFSGIFFPLSALHPAARRVILAMPLTHEVALARMFCYGRIEPGWPLDLAFSLSMAAAAAWAATRLLRRRLIQ